MLYLVTTPIGNLQDLSERAIKTLAEADLILCEDTRRSGLLLSLLKLKKPLKPYHKFNESKELDKVIALMQEGQKVALISDSGTPALCDPGQSLVEACHKHAIAISAIPGPSAPLTALCLSGFATTPFTFWGFCERQTQALTHQMIQALTTPGVSLFFESPKRLKKTLQLIDSLDPSRTLFVARELTKMHESLYKGVAKEVLSNLPEPLLGEITLAIGPSSPDSSWQSLDTHKLVSWLESELNLSRKEALKCAAQLTLRPKSEIYNKIIKNNDFN